MHLLALRISKTPSRRLVPIRENLRTWLQPISKLSGPVLLNPDTRYRHEGARRRAGITKWPDDAMRHSFVSYRLAARFDFGCLTSFSARGSPSPRFLADAQLNRLAVGCVPVGFCPFLFAHLDFRVLR